MKGFALAVALSLAVMAASTPQVGRVWNHEPPMAKLPYNGARATREPQMAVWSEPQRWIHPSARTNSARYSARIAEAALAGLEAETEAWLDKPAFEPPVVRDAIARYSARPQSAVYNPGVEQWRAMVATYWPAEHVEAMLSIMACESHGDPYATNPRSGAAGLFQIMPGWQRTWPGDYYDPWTNAAVAYQIWLTQGYAAWVCKA